MGRPKSSLTLEDKISKGYRVRNLRETLGFTRSDIEKKYGIKASTLRSTESGMNALTLSLARNLCLVANDNGYDCTIDWLISGKGEQPKIQQGTKLQFNGLQDQKLEEKKVTALLESQSLAISYDVRNFLNSYNGYEVDVFRVCDDAMTPQFKIGDYVGGIAISLNKLQDYLDCSFIFELDSGKKILRNFTKYQSDYILYGTNFRHAGAPSVIFNPTLVKAFPVFWHRSFITPWIR